MKNEENCAKIAMCRIWQVDDSVAANDDIVLAQSPFAICKLEKFWRLSGAAGLAEFFLASW
jgi:hypothetical protein